MAAETYRLISHFHSLYIYIFFLIKLYLDIMNDSNTSKFVSISTIQTAQVHL